MSHPQLNSTAVSSTHPSTKKPTVVGLYGISGAGKTFLLNQLKKELGEQAYQYDEGSLVISSIVSGGLVAFQKMTAQEKALWRGRAIDSIVEECSACGRIAVVAGHFMFWDETDELRLSVWTERDQESFTHILYLDVPADAIATYRLKDSRARSPVSEEHIRRWQQAERVELRRLCLVHGILFLIVPPRKVSMLLRDIFRHTEEYNLSIAKFRLNEVLGDLVGQTKMETMLVMDGDKTLISEDTGALFWKLAADTEDTTYSDPLKELFSSQAFGYSIAAFRQAALLYEEVPEQNFNDYCEKVASTVTIHPEFISLLRQAAEKQVGAVVVTCGLRLIWERILQRAGLSDTVKVIGGGCIRERLVVTADVKRALVARLKEVRMYVCAFGDSPLDLPMLKTADRAFVVVGEAHQRSRSMETALLDAINNEGLRAHQVLLPSTASPRLDNIILPQVNITEDDFIVWYCSRKILHATNKNAAKILMTATRNAQVSGPALREAHRSVGQYLATELLPELTGLEEFPIPHVQDRQTSGHRVRHEEKTTIVAVMRGGEPMAFGVNDALPLAMFLHAKVPADVKLHHVEGQQSVILVDSVVNSGKTVVEFVQHIRTLQPTIRILVVAGVIQADSLSKGSLTQLLRADVNVAFVALRLSENKYTGTGTTDTGNRLFNTTHLQ
ncbi:PRTase-like protein [Gymnopus androsaceus JB14]|uniref:PRTase-like protein n=1 Tax=Gymnopus androsaceus JB14 TaxID=1447944 RepID=A0A6A4HA22_9AGAR|nr:PRTase-like protein [Gymnopus androsaceus JB14]